MHNSLFDSGEGLYLPRWSYLPLRVSCQGFPSFLQSVTFGHATIARYTYYTLSFPSVPLSEEAPSALKVTLSQPLRTICHLSSTPSRLLPHPTNKVWDETTRDETRSGQARRGGTGRTAQDNAHLRAETPIIEAPPRSSESGEDHPAVCTTETAAGNRQSAVQDCPLARPCTGLDKLFLILAHPAYATRDPAQSAVPAYLGTVRVRGAVLVQSSSTPGHDGAVTTPRAAG